MAYPPLPNLRVSNYLFYPQCIQHILKQLLQHELKNWNFCLLIFFSMKWLNSIGADSDTRQQSRSLCQFHDKIRHASREAIYKHHYKKRSHEVFWHPILWQFLSVPKLLFADSLENGFICEISCLLALPSAWLLLILACLSVLLLPYSHSMLLGLRPAHLERGYITLSEIKANVISIVIISNSISLCCQFKCFFHKVSWVIRRTNQHFISQIFMVQCTLHQKDEILRQIDEVPQICAF